MITELILLTLFIVALIFLFFTFEYQNVAVGVASAILFLFIGLNFYLGVENPTTVTNYSSTTLGLLFVIIGMYLNYEAYSYNKHNKEAAHDRL